MNSNQQWSKYLDNLGLKYKWVHPKEGASTIVVGDGVLEFKPFSYTLRIKGKVISTSPTQRFKKECEKLAKS